MTILTEEKRNFVGIISEANNSRSRDEYNVVNADSNNTIFCGQPLEASGTNLVAYTGGAIVGLLLEKVPENTTDGVQRAVLARDAEFNTADIEYPENATTAQITAINDGLKALGIVLR